MMKTLREHIAIYLSCLALVLVLSLMVSHLPGCPTITPTPRPPQTQPLVISVIEETAERTPDQAAIYLDPAFVEYVAKHKLQMLDDDVLDPDGAPPADLRAVLAAVAGEKLPQVVLQSRATGDVLVVLPLPATAAELLPILKRYGGE